jgi:hypothetical protein
MSESAKVVLGHALKWCIDTIKAIGDLKHFIEQAKALDIDPAKTAIFDGEIEERVKKRVDEKVQSMLANYKGDPARRAELNNSLHLALEQLLQRVERGMTVEIKLIPPAKPKAESAESAEATERAQAFSDLAAIAKDLEFPQIQGQPALQLTTDDPKSTPP